MRHRVKGKKLSRTSSHRKATFRALAIAVITGKNLSGNPKRINTTVVKAKALRGFLEPLITRAKEDTLNNRREVFAALQDKEAVKILFEEIGPKVGDRQGGYSRVVKAGFRQGDSAETAIFELVDFNESGSEASTSTKKKKTRRAGKATKTEETVETEKKEAPKKVAKKAKVEKAADKAEKTEAVAEEKAADTSSEEESTKE